MYRTIEKVRLVEIDKNDVALSNQFPSLGDSDMSWFHGKLVKLRASYLDSWK